MKNFLKALMPPPAVPRRVEAQTRVKVSALGRAWDAIKPPPAVPKSAPAVSPAERKRRRRIIVLTLSTLVLGSGGWGAYLYISSAPQRAAVKVQEGMRLVAIGNFAAAVDQFTRALEISPGMTTAYLQRGLAHQSLNQPDLALADFTLAIDADPNMGAAHTGLGSLFRQRGDKERAINEFSMAIKLDGDLDAYYQRGQVYESMGEHQKAIDDYDIAINQMRDAPYVYLARAMAKANLGDTDGAEDDRRRGFMLQNHVTPVAAQTQ
jgi:tetratricopeptide (TPR) repeat protein